MTLSRIWARLSMTQTSDRRLSGLVARRLTGPVGETPEPESRRSARSDHKTQPGGASPGWSEDTHRFMRQTNTRKGGYYQKRKPQPGVCVVGPFSAASTS